MVGKPCALVGFTADVVRKLSIQCVRFNGRESGRYRSKTRAKRLPHGSCRRLFEETEWAAAGSSNRSKYGSCRGCQSRNQYCNERVNLLHLWPPFSTSFDGLTAPRIRG